MKHSGTAILAVGLLVSVVNTAHGTMITIPMDLTSWTYRSGGGSGGSVAQTADGLMFFGSGYRQGGGIMASTAENFSNATIYVKWMASGGSSGNYMGVGPQIGLPMDSGWFDGPICPCYTTDHSFMGSQVAPQNTWLYTRLETHPDMSWDWVTATGTYGDQLGSILNSGSTSWSADPNWWWTNYPDNGRLFVGLWDNYGGTSAWVQVGEVKYEIAANSIPEPSVILLFASGLLGLGRSRCGTLRSSGSQRNAVRRKSGTPHIASNGKKSKIHECPSPYFCPPA